MSGRPRQEVRRGFVSGGDSLACQNRFSPKRKIRKIAGDHSGDEILQVAVDTSFCAAFVRSLQ